MQTKITGKMRKALPLLVSGMAGKDVAVSIGVQESTVSHWINHCPQFAAELDRLREQASSQAVSQLSSSVALAADTIRQILITGKTEAAKLRAAEYIINNFGLPLRSNTKQADAISKEFGGKVDMNLVLQGLGTDSNISVMLGWCRARKQQLREPAMAGHPSGWAYGPPSRTACHRKFIATGVYQF